jgi:uncharacterized protein
MDITPLLPAGSQRIQRYGNGTFWISGRMVRGSVWVFPLRVVEVEAASLGALWSRLRVGEKGLLPGSLVLVGTGNQPQRVPEDAMAWCRSQGWAIESMTTAAACRSYNILLAEGRCVSALLYRAEDDADLSK